MDSFTIKDIARKCGVGVSTVSRAINNHPDINPQTKEKILQIIAEAGYVPNNSARNLKRGDSRTVALLVKGIHNLFFSDIIRTIEKKTKEQNYSCILQQVEEEENELELALKLVKEKRLRGIVFLGGSFSHPEEMQKRLTVPFVVSTSEQLEKDGDYIGGSISVDNRKESYKVTDYLCSLGHREIALLTSSEDDESIGKLRLEGYRQALKDWGIAFDPSLVVFMNPESERFSLAGGYHMTKRLLTAGVPFSALYATADTLALGAIRALKETGIRVPEDCSVAGFDGLEAGRYYIPSLTTLEQPAEEMAEATVRHLFQLIQKKGNPERLLFEGKLVVRESTQERKEKREKHAVGGNNGREN